MRRERLARALLLLTSLLLGWGVAELVMAERLPRHLSQVNRLSRAPGSGIGELAPEGPLPFRLERMRVEGGELALQTADGVLRFPLRRSERRRVVALGDSLTEIWNLAGYRNWVGHLQTRLEPVEVVPVGVGGYNTAHEIALLRGELAALEADVLLLQMCPNDAEVLYLHERRSERVTAERTACPTPDVRAVLQTRTLSQDQLWPHHEAIGFDCRERTFDRFLGSRVLWAIDHALNRREQDDAHGTRLIEATPAQRRALKQLTEHASHKNMRVLAVLFPLFAARSQVELEHFRRLLSEVGIPFHDLTQALTHDRPLEAWRSVREDPYHPNEAAHERAAQSIAERLLQLGWLGP